MPRTLLHYTTNDTPEWGILFDDMIAPLALDEGDLSTGQLLTRHWDRIWSMDPSAASLARDRVRLLSPVTPHQQFLCQGVNYRSHVQESGLDLSNFPFNTLFTKAPSCITAADAPVVRPADVRLLDYEIELGLVLRRDLREGDMVHPERLGDWLGGITIVNDLSARDVQLPQGQFYKGKSYRGFGPVGPGLVLLTPEEWLRWPELHMRLQVNGQPRQEAYCRDMIHAPAQTLNEFTSLHNVQAGDLIATGTPAGCAARAPGKLAMFVLRHLVSESTKWKLFIKKGMANPAYLQPGDRLSLTIRTDDGAIDLGEQTTVITD